MLTKGFAGARDACGLFDSERGNLPSFHEIRALGASLYERGGKSRELVQALLGHTSAAMTAHYLSGHGVQWAEIEL